jgi:hypothetical protein
MFPGGTQTAGGKFGAPWPIQYDRRDYTGQTADGSDTWVYYLGTTGWDASADVVLGRVSIANLPKLNRADWTFFQGGDGSLDANWGPLSNAVSVMHSNECRLGMQGAQYLPAFHSYMSLQWVRNGTIDFWKAPHPWGPWTLFQNVDMSTVFGNFLMLYTTNIIPKSVAVDGGMNVVFTGTANPPDYSIWLINVAVH